MIDPKAVIIGIIMTVIMIKLFNFYIFESEFLSSLLYIVIFSFLFQMITKKDKNIKSKNVVHFLDFEETNVFQGKRNGYVFKKGDKGLGYYLDN